MKRRVICTKRLEITSWDLVIPYCLTLEVATSQN